MIDKHTRKQLKPLKIMAIVAVSFAAAWTPYTIVAFTAQFAGGMRIDPYLMTVMSVLTKASTMFNPIIYVCMDKTFRKHAMHMIGHDQSAHKKNMCFSSTGPMSAI